MGNKESWLTNENLQSYAKKDKDRQLNQECQQLNKNNNNRRMNFIRNFITEIEIVKNNYGRDLIEAIGKNKGKCKNYWNPYQWDYRMTETFVHFKQVNTQHYILPGGKWTTAK